MNWREKLESHSRACRGESGEKLSSADLRSANLRWADLRWADLRSADLRWANLRSADLRSADLSSADLRSADLRSADLSSADLRWANLPQIVFVGPLGSRNDILIYNLQDKTYQAGCWRGTSENLIKRIDAVYPSGQFREEYLAAVTALELMSAARKTA